jgi:MurNAc alpha-1-phosphate uridylyltransferase
MILAAGRGERLAPLTSTVPKPLLEIGGTTLIERHIVRLVQAGLRELVVNVSHLAECIEEHLGDGHRYGADILYSREPDGPLETGGGIARALAQLGDAPFLVVNADIWTDYPFDKVPYLRSDSSAHLVVVPNPPHHPAGDFDYRGGKLWRADSQPYTYAGIGLFPPHMFAGRVPGTRFPLAPLLFELAGQGRLAGEIHTGAWFDIGTPERLALARRSVSGVG